MNDRHHNPSDFDRSPDEAGRDAFERDERLNDELLSAYLDGECTANEQAETEARIAANPELRQLADDLRNVRASLEVLPQHRLESNFAERVLRRAEREVLTGGGSTQHDAAGAAMGEREARLPADSAAPSRRERIGSPRFGSARPFLWTVAALAAAVLILITNRDPGIRDDGVALGPEAQLAQTDKSRDRSAVVKGDVKLLSSSPQDERSSDVSAARARRIASVPASASADDGNREPTTGFGAGPDANRGPGIPPATETAPTKPGLANDAVQESVESVVRSRTAAAPQVRLQMDRGVTERQDTQATSPQDGVPALDKSNSPTLADSSRDSVAAPDPNLSAPLAPRQFSTNGVDSLNANLATTFFAPAESLRVVEVLVGRDAWQSGAVTDVLARNRIAVFDATMVQAPAQTASDAPSPGEKAKEQDQLESQRPAQAGQQPSPAEELELFVVSAPAAQVAAALDDFERQEQFRVLQVTDASAPEQLFEQSVRALGVNRGAGGYGYGSATEFRKQQVLDEGASKKEPNAADKAASADEKVQESDVNPVNKDVKATAVSAEPKAAEPKAAEGPPATESKSVAPSGDLAGRGARRFAAPLAAGRSGADRSGADRSGADRSGGNEGIAGGKQGRPFGGGYGSNGGIGYGGIGGGGGSADYADPAGTPPATTADIPFGYAQRLTLQHATPAYRESATNGAAPLRRSPATAEFIQNETAQNAAQAPERVLFFFRVVDAPLAGGVNRVNAAATSADPPKVAEPVPARPEDAKTTPVPAPSTPGPTAR